MLTRHILSMNNHFRQTSSNFTNSVVKSGRDRLEIILGRKISKEVYGKHCEEIIIFVTQTEKYLCIDRIMTGKMNEKPHDICIQHEDAYKSCTLG